MSASPRLVSVEWAVLEGRRLRHAGSNARLGEHGITVRVPIARLIADDGSSGFGFCRASQAQAETLLGQPLDGLFSPLTGTSPAARAFDFPLWDLSASGRGLPVYRLAAAMIGKEAPSPLTVPGYDTSLYFDDLHLESAADAAQLLAGEALQGLDRGHRNFKIKVGRGARHMPLEEGTQRDIAIIRAVRDAIGPASRIMLDANNGYNLNLAKRVLAETADCDIAWLEEAFHEDAVLYRDLKAWLTEADLPILIADGEGQASPSLLDWARDGLIDVVQYDIFGYGFTEWLELGQRLDEWSVGSAPHHYGGLYGNYATAHLAPAIEWFTFVEWDEAQAPGLDTSAYRIRDGMVEVPDLPGFGLRLNNDAFATAVAETGYRVQAE